MIKKLFTPFQQLSSDIYMMLFGMWLLLFIGAWCMAPVLIPPPWEMLSKLKDYLIDPEFYPDVIASLMVTISGMLLSITVACVIAFLTTMPFFKPLGPITSTLRFLSLAGFIFTFTLLLHDAYKVKLGLLMLGIIPFFVLTLTTAIQEIDQQEFDFWATLGFTPFQQLWNIVIVGKSEVVVKTIKFNFAIAWIMIGTVETYSMADGGIGTLMFKANGKTQIDKVFALQFVVLTIGALLDLGWRVLRLRLYPHVALAEKK